MQILIDADACPVIKITEKMLMYGREAPIKQDKDRPPHRYSV